MTAATLAWGSALIAFGPFLALFFLVTYPKSQLIIVVTTSALFFLFAATCASVFWRVFDFLGMNGPLAALIPGVFAQFLVRCGFVVMYHNVEKVIQASIYKQALHAQQQETAQQQQQQRQQQSRRNRSYDSNETAAAGGNGEANSPDAAVPSWTHVAKLRLELNDAASGLAAGTGFGGMHAIMMYGSLLASEMGNYGTLIQPSCPMPGILHSALQCLFFFVLDVFWMLFTFFGMRRRALYPRGSTPEDVFDDEEEDDYMDDPMALRRVPSRAETFRMNNSRHGGNVALIIVLLTHLAASLSTLFNQSQALGCAVSLPCLAVVTMVTAYWYWTRLNPVFLPPTQTRSAVAAAAAIAQAASRDGSQHNGYHED